MSGYNWIIALKEYARTKGYSEAALKKMSPEQLKRIADGGRP